MELSQSQKATLSEGICGERYIEGKNQVIFHSSGEKNTLRREFFSVVYGDRTLAVKQMQYMCYVSSPMSESRDSFSNKSPSSAKI